MATGEPRATELVQSYFRAKARELSAISGQAVAQHPGLKGSHREEICRRYLGQVLPSRYQIGRGMVYGFVHRSREADIVLWDALNYPRLDLADHTFFFAEAVRCVLEVKSRWNSDDLNDVLTKCVSVRSIVSMGPPNLADTIEMIQLDLASLRSGVEHDGMLLMKPRIGTGAIFLQGGGNFGASTITSAQVETADDEWPDVMLLLEPGRFILKRYPQDGEGPQTAQLEFYQLGEDALLAFTSALLNLLSERVVHHESPLYFEMYAGDVTQIEPEEVVQFHMTRPPPLGGYRFGAAADSAYGA